MPCNGPYATVNYLWGYETYQYVVPGTNKAGFKRLGNCPCFEGNICATANPAYYYPYSYNQHSTACCSPCTYPRYATDENGRLIYPLTIDDFQCIKKMTISDASIIDKKAGLSYYYDRTWWNPWEPNEFFVMVQGSNNGYYPFPGTFYSAEADYSDLCCAVPGAANNIYGSSWNYQMAVSDGKVKFNMGLWNITDPNYHWWARLQSCWSCGFPDPFPGTVSMQNIGYLPYPISCGTLNTADGQKLNINPVVAIVAILASPDSCSSTFYVGYSEIEVKKGDLIAWSIELVPESCPSITFTDWTTNWVPQTYDGFTLPYSYDCTYSADCYRGLYYGKLFQFCDYLKAGLRRNDYGYYPVWEKNCTNGYPNPPAFRKRMLEKQVLSRIKKVHYKP